MTEAERIDYLFTVNVDNIFGFRIFFPQWGTLGVLQKGHYGLRGEKGKETRTLVRKWGRWQTQKPTLLPV